MAINVPHAASPEPTTTGLQAVLWDMDGTIIDTEPYWIEAEIELVNAHGGRWSPADAATLVGQSLDYSAAILQGAGVDLHIRGIIDHLVAQVTARVRAAAPWRPGARELLAELQALGIPSALVTMSEGPLAAEVAGQLPEGTFEYLVTGDQVDRGKPDPEAYNKAFALLAATRPWLRKENVLAIEDSLPGVTAAMAAGLVTLAVPHFVPLPADPGRHEWVSLRNRTAADLRELVGSRVLSEDRV